MRRWMSFQCCSMNIIDPSSAVFVQSALLIMTAANMSCARCVVVSTRCLGSALTILNIVYCKSVWNVKFNVDRLSSIHFTLIIMINTKNWKFQKQRWMPKGNTSRGNHFDEQNTTRKLWIHVDERVIKQNFCWLFSSALLPEIASAHCITNFTDFGVFAALQHSNKMLVNLHPPPISVLAH